MTLRYCNFSKEKCQSLCSLADDRDMVIKKANKGSCVVVQDRNNYIAETEKKINNKTIYKNVVFKEKILQDLAETSNNIFESLRDRCKMTKRSLSISLMVIRRLLILERCIYCLKFTKNFLMFLADQFCRTGAHLQKKFWGFRKVILKVLCKKVGPI